MFPRKNIPALSVSPIVTDAFEKAREHFLANRWSAFENFCNNDFVNALRADWPKRYFLNPPRMIVKSYDTGFRFSLNAAEPENINQFPTLEALYQYFRSPEFCERVREATGAPHALQCYSFLVITSYPGSFVAPHFDDQLPPEAGEVFNMLFFVDGTGGTNSGGLTLSKDPELKDIMFEPLNLKNTALIYDVRAPFFHGFHPIAWGKYRLAISASWHSTEYRGYKAPKEM
jgi:hypothetical protein